jgi:hypothetical protein
MKKKKWMNVATPPWIPKSGAYSLLPELLGKPFVQSRKLAMGGRTNSQELPVVWSGAQCSGTQMPPWVPPPCELMHGVCL